MLRTHADATRFLNELGVAATREASSLGDAVVVPLGHPARGATSSPPAAWLVPRSDAAWELVQSIGELSLRRSFADLDTACRAALEIVRAFAREERCGHCGGGARVAFGEHARDGTVQHWIAWSCPNCGAEAEYDGGGCLPDELRALELVRHGEWAVSIEVPETAEQWSALRSELGLDLKGIAALKRSLPGCVLRGTFAEAERLCRALVEEGLVAALVTA